MVVRDEQERLNGVFRCYHHGMKSGRKQKYSDHEKGEKDPVKWHDANDAAAPEFGWRNVRRCRRVPHDKSTDGKKDFDAKPPEVWQ